ncbi:flagellar basal body L-ring protein FlgH [Gemmatimonas aurantiaca]|uniref:flagellar basal body L-ring protein FlgH n=1 Tax=Gemmatimonas aurantiaca TaxID=173480 RepID=UPI00301E5EB7
MMLTLRSRLLHLRHLCTAFGAAGALVLGTPRSLAAQAQPAGQSAGTGAAGATGSASGSAAADSTSGLPPAPTITPRASWTADRRSFAVGDIITVLVDDYTISTAVKENVSTDTRTRGLSVNARLPESSKSVGIDSRNAADQTQRGQARRENRFQNELSVRVVAVGQNGLLQVKGTKVIDVDKSKQDIVFTGWVRAQDISVSNLVESSRVADLQIGYVSPGPLGKPKQGLVSKVLGALWP